MTAADHANTTDLVATIRGALSLLLDVPDNAETHEAALNGSAALDALAAQAETAEGVKPLTDDWEQYGREQFARAEAAEQAAEQARALVREARPYMEKANSNSGPINDWLSRAALAGNTEAPT